MSELSFFVPGRPQPRGSKTAMPVYWGRGAGRIPAMKNGRVVMRYVDAAKGSAKWMKHVRQCAEPLRQDPLWDGECGMALHFVYHHIKSDMSTAVGRTHLPKASAPKFKLTTPDLTKLIRGVEDALTGIVYTDDSRIVTQYCTKGYSNVYEGVLVMLWTHATVFEVDELIDSLNPQEKTP